MEIDTKVEAQEALRKAFVIALYHHWERSARKWTGDDRRDHSKLAIAVEALGDPIHPRLEAVRDLTNLLKHDNDKWGQQLIETWPDVVSGPRGHAGGRTDWYRAVRLTDAHMTEAFNIVGASGPIQSLSPS
ncbi:hypothetical protein L7H23_16255 [Sphingopyxis sp. BSN-002]|uniref:hypothetical protein n=1 Tax=Sphingopyxis sp. BSN-002 TaxID=2911495 RepID=UPI001EDA8340|nr:hypothetical protein [Sphingopyxis sp. BSN-002]UKK84100.1 hypothetical protein L7H23_16255 [Sphingopyxis sp. BSN-002]